MRHEGRRAFIYIQIIVGFAVMYIRRNMYRCGLDTYAIPIFILVSNTMKALSHFSRGFC